MADTKKIPERREIPVEYTWNTADIYPTPEAWEKDFEKAQELTKTLAGYAGRLGESAETLYEYLTLSEDTLSGLLNSLLGYASLRQDEDTRVAENPARASRVISLLVEAQSATAFETPELLKISPETLEQFCAEKPELALYRRYFTVIQDRKEHTRSDAEE